MTVTNAQITRLFSIRNCYGKQFLSEKMQRLGTINIKTINGKKAVQSLYATLLFLSAYPDNKSIYKLANQLLQALKENIRSNEKLEYSLYNTGITGTSICAAFGFEMVKWIRKAHRGEIRLISFEATDAQIQSILSVVMPKAESEILQDANAEWKGWFQQQKKQQDDLLDQLIDVFESSDIRPEVKDELWNAIGINTEINFTSPACLPGSLVVPYYHRSLFRKGILKHQPAQKPLRVKLSEKEGEQIIDCSRMILVRNLREIDPISFTAANRVSYYHLPRGLSVALMGMVPERRHPIDSYMGYVVFKNGLPVAYAGSWILFDSCRIGLNVFPDYRGGESQYIFQQVLQLHARVYRINRFTVDPYQLGKENSDGIHSGAFWVYYHAGFRPIQKAQRDLAAAEALKINTGSNYRSPAAVLKILANSRQELVLQKSAVGFDATDLSRAYAGVLIKKYNSNRLLAEKGAVKKLAGILQVKNYREDNIHFILRNWAVFLLCKKNELSRNSPLKKTLKKLFTLKAGGSEEAYITLLQQTTDLGKLLAGSVKDYALD